MGGILGISASKEIDEGLGGEFIDEGIEDIVVDNGDGKPDYGEERADDPPDISFLVRVIP